MGDREAYSHHARDAESSSSCSIQGASLLQEKICYFLHPKSSYTSSNMKTINLWHNKTQAPDSVGSRIGKSCCLLFLSFFPGSMGICSAEWAAWGGLQFEEQHCVQSLLDWLTKRASGNHPPRVTRSALLQASRECAKIWGCIPILKMRDFVASHSFQVL